MCETITCAITGHESWLWQWVQSQPDSNPILVLIGMTLLVVVTWRLLTVIRELDAEPAGELRAIYEAPGFEDERRAS